VTVTSGLVPAGRLRFVHNWSWDPVTLPAPSALEDVLSGDLLGQGSDVVLGAWDVRILLEPAT
jgi:beta-galactosidase